MDSKAWDNFFTPFSPYFFYLSLFLCMKWRIKEWILLKCIHGARALALSHVYIRELDLGFKGAHMASWDVFFSLLPIWFFCFSHFGPQDVIFFNLSPLWCFFLVWCLQPSHLRRILPQSVPTMFFFWWVSFFFNLSQIFFLINYFFLQSWTILITYFLIYMCHSSLI